jgi:hypothetical protein
MIGNVWLVLNFSQALVMILTEITLVKKDPIYVATLVLMNSMIRSSLDF